MRLVVEIEPIVCPLRRHSKQTVKCCPHVRLRVLFSAGVGEDYLAWMVRASEESASAWQS